MHKAMIKYLENLAALKIDQPINGSEATCVSLGNHCNVADDQVVQVIVDVSLH